MTPEEYAKKMGGPVARAAEEGYDVRMAVANHVVNTLPSQSERLGLGGLPLVVKRPAPTAQAFEVMDELVHAYAQLDLPDGVECRGWKICRATWPGGDKSTVVTARLITPDFPPRLLVWDAE